MEAKAFEIAGLPRDEISRFVVGLHSDPFCVLGPHKVGEDVEIRVFCPKARAIEIVLDREPNKPIAANRSDEEGFFCATAPGAERDVVFRAGYSGAKETFLITTFRGNRFVWFSI